MTIVRGLIGIIFMALFMIGCTPTRNEFTVFAQAGAGYSAAVDNLLVAAGTTQIESTSWEMVNKKKTMGMNVAVYKQLNQNDLNQLEQIARLRKHAAFLGQYFGMLEALATSDAPQRTQTAIDGVMTNLSQIKTDLPPITTELPAIAGVAVNFKIRNALREELENRQQTIREHIEVQEILLPKLARQIKMAIERSQSVKEQQFVIDPIVSDHELKKIKGWISERREILVTPTTIQELEAASITAQKLREAFEGVISGEDSMGRLNALITDIESMLSIAEAIKQ